MCVFGKSRKSQRGNWRYFRHRRPLHVVVSPLNNLTRLARQKTNFAGANMSTVICERRTSDAINDAVFLNTIQSGFRQLLNFTYALPILNVISFLYFYSVISFYSKCCFFLYRPSMRYCVPYVCRPFRPPQYMNPSYIDLSIHSCGPPCLLSNQIPPSIKTLHVPCNVYWWTDIFSTRPSYVVHYSIRTRAAYQTAGGSHSPQLYCAVKWDYQECMMQHHGAGSCSHENCRTALCLSVYLCKFLQWRL